MALKCVQGLLRPENHASDIWYILEIITELQKAGRERLGRDEEREGECGEEEENVK